MLNECQVRSRVISIHPDETRGVFHRPARRPIAARGLTSTVAAGTFPLPASRHFAAFVNAMNLKRRIAKRLERLVGSAEPAPGRTTARDPEVRGAIDVLHEGAICGWISDRSHRAVDSIDCTIDGGHAGSQSNFHFREDLKDLGYGDGVLGFRVPIARPLRGQRHTVRIHAFAEGRKLGALTREMHLGQHPVASANPFLRLSNEKVPDGWAMLPDRRRALKVTREHGADLPGALSRYVRLISDLERDGAVGLSQRIRVDPANDHTVVVVARSLTGNAIRVRTSQANGSSPSHEEIPLGGAWSVLRIPYRTVAPEADVQLTICGAGHAVVDLACLAVVPEPPERAAIPLGEADEVPEHQREPDPANTYTPTTWDRGARFAGPRRGSELASGWFFECTRGQESSFEAARAPEGMAVRHDLSTGYSRIAVKCERNALLGHESIGIAFDITAASERGRRVFISIIGRNDDQSVALIQRAVVLPISGRAEITANLSRGESAALRTNASRFASLEIALELHAPYALEIHALRLFGAESLAEPGSVEMELGDDGFEDPIVAAQAPSLLSTRAVPAVAAALHRIDVVVPVFNAAADVDRMLSSLVEANDGSYRVLVVDDASGPRTARILDRAASRERWVRLARHDDNRGYTASINHGVSLSGAPMVVILNSDTVVPHGWHHRLLCAFEAHPRTGIVGPLSNAASWQSLPHRFSAAGDWLVNDIPGNLDVHAFQRWLERSWLPRRPLVPLLNGFCMAYRREVFQDVGTFDEDAFPVGYGEENDICLRAAAKGWELRVADDLYVYHAKSRSFQGRRAELTAAGNERLREKHAAADWPSIIDALRHHPDLKAIRDHVAHAFLEGSE
jgi:GT2 family glycosyltransferase